MPNLRRLHVFRVLALLLGTAVALAGAELVLRATKPYKIHRAAQELRQFRDGGATIAEFFELDPELGFRPRLGTEAYSPWGSVRSEYPLAKDPAKRRLLFLGDSVTYRGEIVDALRARFGDERFEYWNAGVESYNTAQTVAFYRRYSRRIEPDHVILTFHLNDFQSTPIAFHDREGNLVVYAPHRSPRTIDRALFERFHLYRLYVGLLTRRRAARERIAGEVEAALVRLQETLPPSTRLTVLIFPILTPFEDWTREEKWAHETITRILERRGISHIDLLPTLERALAAGVPVREAPDDPWHPSPEFAATIARDLEARGFLADTSTQTR